MTGTMMKAIRIHEFGGPEVLRYEHAMRPGLAAGEVLVQVHAVGLNPPDWYLREGFPDLPDDWRPKLDFPIIPGTDISGVVTDIAADVDAFAPGDNVYSMVRFPGNMKWESMAYAEYVAVPASELARKPANINHVEAAGAPMSLLTAWQFMVAQGHDVANPLQPAQHVPVPLKGKTVLVNGAAGGVGHLAVQIARNEGARVIAVASGAHEGFLRGLGADDFVDYTNVASEDVVRDVDLVVDCVGGPTSNRFLKTLKPGGSLFPIYGLGASGAEKAKAMGLTMSTTQVRSSGAQLAEVAPLLDSGAIKVAIDSTYPLADAAKAHERAARGHIRGKIVLTVL